MFFGQVAERFLPSAVAESMLKCSNSNAPGTLPDYIGMQVELRIIRIQVGYLFLIFSLPVVV